MSPVDINSLGAWVGKQETRSDVITQAPVTGLSATLGYTHSLAPAGEALPPLWHWLYFLSAPPAAEVDVDGHARRGGFLPPVSLPRRMWAGGSIRFVAPLYVGDEVQRVSTISDIRYKEGSSGPLVFVTLSHQVYRGADLAIEELQNLVYREAAGTSPAAPGQPASAAAQWSRELEPDPVLLFRYSALTFNSHRIHYDRGYATTVEAYPGLVVQGPLTATLLLDAVRRELPDAQLASFEFRGLRPLFEGELMQLQGYCDGGSVELWALDASGAVAMTARAGLR